MTYKGLEGYMLMDHSTITNLELVRNRRTGRQENTLFSTLNHCNTTCGSRLLRVNVLQPPSNIETVEMRLDAIEELVLNEEGLSTITSSLTSFLDVDHLCAIQFISHGDTLTDEKSCQQAIGNIILLKTSLDLVPVMREAFTKFNEGEGPRNPLLAQILENLSNPVIEEMRQRIDEQINEKVKMGSNSIQIRNQQCFAVKQNVNGLLDVARRTYSEILSDIFSLANQYKEQYLLNSLKVKETVKRGFHFVLPKSNKFNPKDNSEFVQVSSKGKQFKFSSETLISLNSRFKECVNEIFLLTGRTIEELIVAIKKQLSVIYLLSDSIAMLDMLCSFANYVILTENCGQTFFQIFVIF